MNKRIITASAAAIVLAFAGVLKADFAPVTWNRDNFSIYTNGANVVDMEALAGEHNYTNTVGSKALGITGNWSSGEDFAEGEFSTINDGGTLTLNTGGAVVTNAFIEADLINAILEAGYDEGGNGETFGEYDANGDVVIKTTVNFVPSDSIEDFSAEQTSDSDLKFAIYAYADEEVDPPTTNLVVYHAYWDSNGAYYVNDVFSNQVEDIDFTQPVTLTVTMRNPLGEKFRMFKVLVEQQGVAGVTLESDDFGCSDAAIDPNLGDAVADGGPWFMTANGEANDAFPLHSLNFKGTGEVSDIQVGFYGEGGSTPEEYTVSWTGSENVVVSNGTAEVSGTSGSFAAGTVLVFYPTEGSITNVNGTARDPGLPSYSYTVTTDVPQTLVVLAGEEEVTPPAPTLYVVDWAGSENVAVTTNGTAVASGDSFEAGTEITFTATAGSITNVTGYVTDTPTNAFVYVVTTDVPQTLVVLAGVEPEPPVPTKPAWFDDNAAADVAAAYDTWAAGQSVSDLATTDYSAQFLMNVNATVSVVALTIDAIEITEDGTQITVGATGDNVGIDLEQINGVLNVYVAETLGVWEHKSIPAANLEYDAAGKAIVIIPATEGKFVKASVDYAEGEDGDIDEVAQP